MRANRRAGRPRRRGRDIPGRPMLHRQVPQRSGFEHVGGDHVDRAVFGVDPRSAMLSPWSPKATAYGRPSGPEVSRRANHSMTLPARSDNRSRVRPPMDSQHSCRSFSLHRYAMMCGRQALGLVMCLLRSGGTEEMCGPRYEVEGLMLNFDIAFTGETAAEDRSVAVGMIRLGGRREFFRAVVGFWTIEENQESWVAMLRRLVAGAKISCLLTSVSNPAEAEFFTAWPLYRYGDDVYVQNHLVFADELDHDFDPDAPWESIEPHRRIDEDGDRISEWRIIRADIEQFVVDAAL